MEEISNIVFADTPNIDAAVTQSLGGILETLGSLCSWIKAYNREFIADEFTEKIMNQSKDLVVGDPLNLNSNFGAVSSNEQLIKNLKHVNSAIDDGAKLRIGGKQINKNTGGFYMEPTIFSDVDNQMTIAKEEVFGPVLSVIKCKNEEDAVQIANDTNYGLAAAVWTSDLSKAHRMIKSIRAGVVHVNCYGGADITVPLGGVKQSGNGHDRSLHALENTLISRQHGFLFETLSPDTFKSAFLFFLGCEQSSQTASDVSHSRNAKTEYGYAAIATPDNFGSDVSQEILSKGGNAVDAAIATGFALAVTYIDAET